MASRIPIPMPDDFAATAVELTMRDLTAKYGVSSSKVAAWIKQAGIDPHRHGPGTLPAPIPVDFAKYADRSTADLCERYGVGRKPVIRWRKEIGIVGAARPVQPMRAVPDDFVSKARLNNRSALSEIYGVGHVVISRWIRESGADVVVSKPAWTIGPQPTPLAPRDSRRETRAAEWLRSPRGGGWVVFRCTEAGAADWQGEWWRVGRQLMDRRGMLEMAIRKGFEG